MELCRILGERRNRPVGLVLRPSRLQKPCDGLIVPGDGQDFVIHEQFALAQPHLLHLVAHQLGHLVLEHEPRLASGERELGAEAFASVLGERAGFSLARGASPNLAALQRQTGALAELKNFLKVLDDGRPAAAQVYRGGRDDGDSTVEAQVYRTFIAIHDVWLQLWEFLDIRVGERARAAATESGMVGEQQDAMVDAAQLACALEVARRSAGGPPPYRREGAPHCRDNDFPSEVAYLLLVADAWRSPLVAALIAEERADLQQRK
ncbi:DUF6545 domain-containing protein [Cryptosporangium sp. NPDC048952]|uniref:DUF6545 domain-containing protein n=1 Tax=Cryptosporangium sp. NPDC048952 TaxID=3363961 RepID=UPI003713F0B0